MSDNPYESSDVPGDAIQTNRGSRSPLRTITKVAIFVILGILLIALFLPATRTAREPARRNGCLNNLRQIALALRNYESANGSLPPAYTVDEKGNRLHSWRTLVLPYMEETQLFESIDLSKPWDDPANAEARKARVMVYSCPSSSHADDLTTYLGVIGPNCVFSGPVPRKLSEVTDGPEKTIVVIDVDSDQAVHWMSPHDVDEATVLGYGPESRTNHQGIITAGFLDGHAVSIPLGSDPDNRRAMLTIAGGESTAD